VKDERARSGGAGVSRLDARDEEGVVAGLELVGDAAAQPPGRFRELWRPFDALSERDSLPQRDRRHASREMLREVLLSGGQDAHRELAGLAQQLVQRGVAPDREADLRRVARKRHERGDRQPGRLPADVHGDDRHSGRDAAHDRAKLFAAHHAAMIRVLGRR